MRRLAACLIVLAVTFQWSDSRAAEPAEPPPYIFTINGLPFAPRVFSLHGDPRRLAPGDLIALGTLLLTLGPERDCRFVITPENEDRLKFNKVFLRLANGRQRVVGVRVFADSWDHKGNIVNPLPKLSADEIRGLWGIYLGAWSDDIAKKLRQIDPARTCITVAGNALIQQKGQNAFPPLPNDIQYLNTEGVYGNVENGESLQQWAQLRFLRLEGNRDIVFDARWLDNNRLLRRLDLTLYTIEHPEAMS